MTGPIDAVVLGLSPTGLFAGRELHRAGATICMVTHDPRYARHADRSIHVFDGRVVEEQTEMAVTE